MLEFNGIPTRQVLNSYSVCGVLSNITISESFPSSLLSTSISRLQQHNQILDWRSSFYAKSPSGLFLHSSSPVGHTCNSELLCLLRPSRTKSTIGIPALLSSSFAFSSSLFVDAFSSSLFSSTPMPLPHRHPLAIYP
ncbi:Uncharacterized protein APZ42_017120 [Daphnia magna]|uniref:Uncharacterized protein n=1 Tax=Daphnia magna TaxID=35525 RepID=A0A162CKV3_9CRUS|nr:Uncharacterized protein APZ42_017120 [Daphnia magna]